MPQLSPITVKDRAATPVDHTYEPSQTDNSGVSTLLSSSGIPIGDKSISVSTRRTNGAIRVKLVFTDPVLVTETVNGVSRPKVDRTAKCFLDFAFSTESTLQERKDLVGKVASALASDQTFLMEVLQDAKGIY